VKCTFSVVKQMFSDIFQRFIIIIIIMLFFLYKVLIWQLVNKISFIMVACS